MSKNKLFFIIFFISVILDQATKIALVMNKAYRSEPYVVIPGFFDIVHVHNPGAAFGIMKGQMFIFAIFTIIAMVFVYYTLKELEEEDRFENIALSLIASGAVGNAIDRTYYTITTPDNQGYVVDFLRVYIEYGPVKDWLISQFGTYEWPSFNVADAAIVVGLIMFLIHGMFLAKDNDDLSEDLEDRKLIEDENEESKDVAES